MINVQDKFPLISGTCFVLHSIIHDVLHDVWYVFNDLLTRRLDCHSAQ